VALSVTLLRWLLGYQRPVGEHLNDLVSAKAPAIACRAWCSVPRHLAGDRFTGWSGCQKVQYASDGV
jgi:hypothetical protein